MVFEGVELSFPPSSFFNTPPDADPLTLPPPLPAQSFRSLLSVDPEFYHWSYSASLPVTFSITYFIIVTICNAINRKRGNKPSGISKTLIFKAFVLLHNLTLAVYSGVTCAALVRTLYVSFPGWFGSNGLPGAVDALCKMHGPRGYGNAVIYDPTKLKWKAVNRAIHLDQSGKAPDSSDVGRIWNEGLAFWGWLFYLSKYYEVMDTIIILLKGKRATTLQKYHHAGALLCMWAGMRYMSPPIWMFVLVNSGIHTMMYTFYTASTVGIRVPGVIKQSITTLQILQFVVGASYAALHLFISYRVPVSIPLKIFSVASAVVKAAPSMASSSLSVAANGSYNHKIPPWLKRLLYRAAGAEGLADNVSDLGQDTTLGASNFQKPMSRRVKEYTYTRTHMETVRCLDTSGEAFAIWLNVIYLTPLTMLFLRFFWKSYIVGTKMRKRKSESPPSPRRLSVSAMDAARQTSESFEEYGTEFEKSIGFGETNGDEAVIVTETVESIETIPQELKNAYNEMKTDNAADAAAETLEEVAEGLKRTESKASSKSERSKANGVSRIPSRTKKIGGFSEQQWFGGRSSSSSSSLRNQKKSTVEQEETTSTSTSVSTSQQTSSWTDIRSEESSQDFGFGIFDDKSKATGSMKHGELPETKDDPQEELD